MVRPLTSTTLMNQKFAWNMQSKRAICNVCKQIEQGFGLPWGIRWVLLGPDEKCEWTAVVGWMILQRLLRTTSRPPNGTRRWRQNLVLMSSCLTPGMSSASTTRRPVRKVRQVHRKQTWCVKVLCSVQSKRCWCWWPTDPHNCVVKVFQAKTQ